MATHHSAPELEGRMLPRLTHTQKPWPAYVGNQFGAAMAYLDTATVLFDTYAPTCGTQTDIGGYLNGSPEINLRGSSTYGAALCTKPLYGWGGGVCDQGSIIIHSTLTGTTGQFRKTTCHEIGHMVGLRHFPSNGLSVSSCMVSGTSTVSTYYPAEITAVNSWYNYWY
nr:hypothetical protein [Microbacterium hydrocarbonoxydans]